MLHIYTLRYAAVWHCRLHDLDAVVFKEVVEITFPDSSSLDSVGVDRLREECVKMQNLQKREGVNLERSLQTPVSAIRIQSLANFYLKHLFTVEKTKFKKSLNCLYSEFTWQMYFAKHTKYAVREMHD